MLMSALAGSRRSAKYRLLHVVRTTKANNDLAFSCIMQKEDDAGIVGVKLSRDLMSIAGATQSGVCCRNALLANCLYKLLFYHIALLYR